MAIAPTPNNNIYKGLVFDDIDSRDYGIYITGEAVFNSPERDVEMIEIPGRNGTYALDKGRFHNIEVTYPAGLFGGSEADFAAGIRAFRNALASRIGYKRLEDDYNPDEYRMAVYSAGLDVTPAQLKAGEFEITFDCKPQRFLKSGETAVSVASGGTITNPTLFEAHPLLQVWGYGGMTIDGVQLFINSGALGTVELPYTRTVQYEDITAGSSVGVHATQTLTFDSTFLNNHDRITVSGFTVGQRFFSDYDITSATPVNPDFIVRDFSANGIAGKYSLADMNMRYSETFSPVTRSTDIEIDATDSGTSYSTIAQMQMRFSYDAANTITVEIWGFTMASASWIYAVGGDFPVEYSMRGNSSQSALGEPLYFDLDIGEAYKIEDGQTVSANNAVTIPAKLPVLVPGSNAITYDNTITQLKVVPRWWEV